MTPYRLLPFALMLATLLGFAGTVPPGTDLVVRLDREIERPNKKNRTETFSATLDQPVFVNGTEMLPSGSRVEGDVRGDKSHIQLSPRQIFLPDGRQVDFNASVRALDNDKIKMEQREGTIRGGGDAGGATRQAAEIGMAGAGIGGMAGGAKGMGIGAIAGVAAVLIGRRMAGHSHGTAVVPAGTQLTLTLNRALDVPNDAAAMHSPDKSDPDERRPILRRQN